MINISKNRNLQPVVDLWCEDLKKFLTEHLVGYSRPHIKYIHGHRIYFATRWTKYKFELYWKSRWLATKARKRILWTYIATFISHLDENIKADKNRIDILVSEQDSWTDSEIKDIIKEVFTEVYEDFTKIYGYKYLQLLKVKTCPYCNRQYTFTIQKNSLSKDKFCTRPEFDHFYEKSNYPLLALTFYNLVPSCHECNHGKLAAGAGVNPYFDGFRSKFVIQDYNGKKLNKNEIQGIKDVNSFRIGFEGTTDEEETNIRSFGLNRQYNEHRDYVQEIIEKSVTYDAVLQQGIVDSFQGIFHSARDVHQFVWGKYLDDAFQERRPLSKLTNDILSQIGID